MSTGNSWEGLRHVCATLLVPERLCGALQQINDYLYFTLPCVELSIYLRNTTRPSAFHLCRLSTVVNITD